MKTLDIENQSYYFGKDSRSDETPVNYEQSTRLSTVRDVAIAVLYVHFNKLQFAIIAMLIMYKVSEQIMRRYWSRRLHVFRRISTTVSCLSSGVVHPRPDLRTSYFKLQPWLKIIVIIWRRRLIILACARYKLSLKIKKKPYSLVQKYYDYNDWIPKENINIIISSRLQYWYR